MPICPNKNKPEQDIVYTPENVAIEIINRFPTYGKILDPCRGLGVFYNNYPDSLEKNWCELSEGIDFLTHTGQYDWIITNPPWSKMREFLIHGMKLSDNIVYLSLFNHFVTKRRLKDIRESGYGIREFYGLNDPPKPWPATGFQLVACWLSKGYNGPVTFSGTISQ